MSDLLQRPSVIALGSDFPGGTYLLRLHVAEPLRLRFGRFQGGKPINVPTGDYLYVGSALAVTGSMRLAPRLLRHATRSANRPPQPIRPALANFLQQIGLLNAPYSLPRAKKLFWNVDHLLDDLNVTLTHILMIRSPQRLESDLAHLLEADPQTDILEKGLGANDLPGNTHLLRVTAAAGWWQSLPTRLSRRFDLAAHF
jgi:Uri superfamily endonuclease